MNIFEEFPKLPADKQVEVMKTAIENEAAMCANKTSWEHSTFQCMLLAGVFVYAIHSLTKSLEED